MEKDRDELPLKIWTTNQYEKINDTIDTHLQLMHAFPRLRGCEISPVLDLDPLGVRFDIIRTEKEKKHCGTENQLKKRKLYS